MGNNGIRSVSVSPLADSLDIIARADKMMAQMDKDDRIFNDILNVVSNGGSLLFCAERLGVPYSRLSVWVNGNEDRRSRLKAAMACRDEYVIARITDELRMIGLHDIGEVLNDDGSIKPARDWPVGFSRCVSSIEIDEFEGNVKTKLRMIDKLRGLDSLVKAMNGFIEKKQVNVEHTYKMSPFDIEERLAILNGGGAAENDAVTTGKPNVIDVRPDDGRESVDL